MSKPLLLSYIHMHAQTHLSTITPYRTISLHTTYTISTDTLRYLVLHILTYMITYTVTYTQTHSNTPIHTSAWQHVRIAYTYTNERDSYEMRARMYKHTDIFHNRHSGHIHTDINILW
ncbi:hypothetical protein EON63_17930 [archaeon]|nr:MAG: hypothetical protein EON63_17930 [archaeon]